MWNPRSARWGETPAEWTGWSIDNPGNNYYYSFVEATMSWALASGNTTWLDFLRTQKLPPLKAYYAELPGGGSLEGTGYGAAHMRLFALYRLWKDSTGEDLANASAHLSDSIRFWVHATMPTLDRFAPIGDQSRSSQPELFDYHRRLVLGHASSNDEDARDGLVVARRDLDPADDARLQLPPRPVAGRRVEDPAGRARLARPRHRPVFARTGWDRDAMWFGFGAGPIWKAMPRRTRALTCSPATGWPSEEHLDAGGIQQGTEVNNVVRFERDGKPIRQREGTVSKLEVRTLDTATGEGRGEASRRPIRRAPASVDGSAACISPIGACASRTRSASAPARGRCSRSTCRSGRRSIGAGARAGKLHIRSSSRPTPVSGARMVETRRRRVRSAGASTSAAAASASSVELAEGGRWKMRRLPDCPATNTAAPCTGN